MATYTLLNQGSSGSDVKKLQQSLIDAGYNVGSSGADGIYGSNTAAAVKRYQQDKGLTVDGIAGEQTLGKLYGTTSPTGTTTQTKVPQQNTTQQKPSQPTQVAVPKYPTNTYDPVSDAAYQQALSALQNAQKQMPTYAGTYDQQLQEIYDKIINRDKFSYDLNADALYQQYADQYALQGEMASMDVMGQATALTGGYGNSYAQMVGQQTYQGYLQELNNIVPELYGMALDQYNAEGDRLYDQYAMLGDMADDEYGRYQDSLNDYWQNISYLKGEADDAYERGYNEWYNAYKMGIDADDRAYSRQQDSYERLVSLITSTGYTPTAEELMAAGMSESQAQAYANYYAQQNAPKSSGGSGSSYSGSNTRKITPTNADPKAAVGAKEEPVEEPYDIEAEANALVSRGASKSELSYFLRTAWQSGVVSDAEYKRLKEIFVPVGLTY